jgi:uncharacterized membrane protein YdbT with pleckstrin-like domain
MSYIRDSLGANEKIHYVAHFHWFHYALAYGVLITGVVIAVLTVNSELPVLALFPLLIGAALFIWLMMPMWTIEIGVTDQRIIFKRGLFTRETEELQLRNVEEVNLTQDFLGRIFGWGQINVHGTGGEDIVLPTIGDPIGMRQALQEAVGGAQDGAPLPDRGAMPQGA